MYSYAPRILPKTETQQNTNSGLNAIVTSESVQVTLNNIANVQNSIMTSSNSMTSCLQQPPSCRLPMNVMPLSAQTNLLPPKLEEDDFKPSSFRYWPSAHSVTDILNFRAPLQSPGLMTSSPFVTSQSSVYNQPFNTRGMMNNFAGNMQQITNRNDFNNYYNVANMTPLFLQG